MLVKVHAEILFVSNTIFFAKINFPKSTVIANSARGALYRNEVHILD